MKLITVIIFVALLCGCATTQKLRNHLNALEGQNIEVVVEKLGYPGHQFTAPNGNAVYQYNFSETFQKNKQSYTQISPNGYSATTTTSGGGTFTQYCNIYFEVDESGTVVKASFQGNFCKST